MIKQRKDAKMTKMSVKRKKKCIEDENFFFFKTTMIEKVFFSSAILDIRRKMTSA